MTLPLRVRVQSLVPLAILCLASVAATCASAQQLSIANASITEGDSGTQSMNFTISLSAPSARAAIVDVKTSNGTALAASDYLASTSLGLRIPAGTTSATFAVPVVGDTGAESEESFFVNLSNPVGATISDGQAIGTITDNDGGGDSAPALRIMDAEVNETEFPTRELQFYAVLTRASDQDVTFDLASADGTATAGSDYAALSLPNQRIPAGQTFKLFAVNIYGDTDAEMNETVLVNASNVQGAAVADATGIMTITNDDAVTINIDDASITEGHSGTKAMSFRVWLSAPTSGPIYFSVATMDGTAKAGSDYGALNLTQQFIDTGESEKQFVVNVSGDTAVEPDEGFAVTVYNVSAANLGDVEAVGTITNDDVSGGSPVLTIADVSMAEGNRLSRQMTFTVTLSAAAAGPVTYNIATANGTALAPGDYTAQSLTGQSIVAGATSKTFKVAIKGDTVAEANETFKVNVTGVSGATLGDGQAIGTITNDDAAALRIARFDAGDLVDDVDDGQREPRVTTKEYAALLADGARSMCRRSPGSTLIAVDGVEHGQVLADLAVAANALCAGKPRYDAVMADTDSRGFLIAKPAEGEAATRVLGQPEKTAGGTALSILVPGHAQPVTVLLADGRSKTLAAQLQLRAQARPSEALVLLGANIANGFLDLTARALSSRVSPLPRERILVNAALLERYRDPGIELIPLPADEAPAQALELR